MTNNETQEKILRLSDVLDKTGLSKSTLYAMVSDERFPKPISLGLRCSGWLNSEINGWINHKIQERDNKDNTQTMV